MLLASNKGKWWYLKGPLGFALAARAAWALSARCGARMLTRRGGASDLAIHWARKTKPTAGVRGNRAEKVAHRAADRRTVRVMPDRECAS